MDLSPNERAVLSLIRALFLEDFQKTHALAVLRRRWGAAHDEVHTGGYQGLLEKGLIAESDDGASFTVTKKGLNAIAARAA